MQQVLPGAILLFQRERLRHRQEVAMRGDSHQTAVILHSPGAMGAPALVWGHHQEPLVVDVGGSKVLGGVDFPLGKVQLDGGEIGFHFTGSVVMKLNKEIRFRWHGDRVTSGSIPATVAGGIAANLLKLGLCGIGIHLEVFSQHGGLAVSRPLVVGRHEGILKILVGSNPILPGRIGVPDKRVVHHLSVAWHKTQCPEIQVPVQVQLEDHEPVQIIPSRPEGHRPFRPQDQIRFAQAIPLRIEWRQI